MRPRHNRNPSFLREWRRLDRKLRAIMQRMSELQRERDMHNRLAIEWSQDRTDRDADHYFQHHRRMAIQCVNELGELDEERVHTRNQLNDLENRHPRFFHDENLPFWMW